MIKIIAKAILSTAVIVVAFVVIITGVVAVLHSATESWGRYAPMIVCGSICVAVIFSLCVSFFRFDAKCKNEKP